MRKNRISMWVASVPMMLLACMTLYPMLYALNIALKGKKEYVLDRFGIVSQIQIQNFANAWVQADMGRYYLNSIIVTSVSVFFILMFSSMAGYALSHLKFRGSSLIYTVIIGSLMIPFQVIMVPIVRMLHDMGLLNTHLGLICAYVAQFLPFTVFFMTSFYSGIPKEMTEAARVDGCGPFAAWFRIMIPIGKPALISMGILNALFCWNDILIALLVIQSPTNRTVMVGVSALRGQYPDNVPTYMAGVLLVVIPLVIVYFIFQRQVTAGVTAGATKG